MTTQKSTTGKVIPAPIDPVTKDRIVSLYMEYVLEEDRIPRSVYKFCKDNDLKEDEFYEFFGSFEGLQKSIWIKFFTKTTDLLFASPEFESFSTREKLLTFYYTFFEILTANRSYILFTLSQETRITNNLEQLKGLRSKVKVVAGDLVREGNAGKPKYLKQSKTVFSEAAWIQLLFLLKFWKDDNSAKFESTDIAIEKSVNTVFDLFDNTPLERVVDLGKFLWKEKMA